MPPTGESQMKYQVLGSSLTHPWLSWPLGSKAAAEKSVSPCLCCSVSRVNTEISQNILARSQVHSVDCDYWGPAFICWQTCKANGEGMSELRSGAWTYSVKTMLTTESQEIQKGRCPMEELGENGMGVQVRSLLPILWLARSKTAPQVLTKFS